MPAVESYFFLNAIVAFFGFFVALLWVAVATEERNKEELKNALCGLVFGVPILVLLGTPILLGAGIFLIVCLFVKVKTILQD